MAFELDTEWKIDSDSKADWAVQKIEAHQREIERLKALAEEQIALINERLEDAQKRNFDKIEHLKFQLMGYFDTVEHTKTKKTNVEKYALLSGTLTRTPARQKPTPNKQQLLEWLAANGYTDYIKTTQEPQWGEFKKVLDVSDGVVTVKETGEVVEGVTLEEVPEAFEVKFAKSKKDGEE